MKAISFVVILMIMISCTDTSNHKYPSKLDEYFNDTNLKIKNRFDSNEITNNHISDSTNERFEDVWLQWCGALKNKDSVFFIKHIDTLVEIHGNEDIDTILYLRGEAAIKFVLSTLYREDKEAFEYGDYYHDYYTDSIMTYQQMFCLDINKIWDYNNCERLNSDCDIRRRIGNLDFEKRKSIWKIVRLYTDTKRFEKGRHCKRYEFPGYEY